MRGDITLFILKTIQAVDKTAAAISDAITSNSISNANRRFWGGMAKPKFHKPIFEKEIKAREKRRRIYQMIAKLKTEGLVGGKRGEILKITQKGLFKIQQLEEQILSKPNYEIVKSNEIKIITFDVPEPQRVARKWLRDALKQLKFSMLQKSVWVGASVVPENFLEDLRLKEIFDCVEIFAVTKGGTLRQIQ